MWVNGCRVLATLAVVGAVFCTQTPIALGQEEQDLSPSTFAFPDSQSVRTQESDALETYEFILSPVETAARELQIDESLRLPAQLKRETWQLPGNATFAEIRDYLRQQLRAAGFVTLFECEGRDCGRSSLWANKIWNLALLYGPNTSQFYVAMHNEEIGVLAALYLVQRGNRRIYANLDLIRPTQMPRFESARQLVAQLREVGWVRLSGALPSTSWMRGLRNDVGNEVRDVLTPVAEQVSKLAGERIYVVCHLYGPESSNELVEASGRWAELIAAELESEDGPELMPFGVGPLSPRLGQSGGSRVELVLGE